MKNAGTTGSPCDEGRLKIIPQAARGWIEMMKGGGLLVCTPADAQRPYARTLIQPDGDLTTQVHPDIEPELLERHYAAVREELQRIEGWGRDLARMTGEFGLLLFLSVHWGITTLLEIPQELDEMAAYLVTAAAGWLVAGLIKPVVFRLVIRYAPCHFASSQ